MALPRSHEEGEPTFTHYGEESLPVLGDRGVRLRLIAGEALGARSPVSTPMAMIYADVQLEAGASVPFDPTYVERGLYTVSGTIEIAGDRFGPGQLGRRPDYGARRRTSPLYAARRRPDGWATAYLVELCLVLPGAD